MIRAHKWDARGICARCHVDRMGAYTRQCPERPPQPAINHAEEMLRDLLAVIHGDGGHDARTKGLENSCMLACWKLADLAVQLNQLHVDLQGAEMRLGELLSVIHGDGGHHAQRHGLEESCRQAHERIADLRSALDAAEERGLHAKRDTRPMARELCERMRRTR